MAQSSVDSDRLSSAGISTHSSVTAGPVGGSVVGVRVGDPGLKREDEDEYNLGPLPPMWEKAFTPSGEVYFIDHNTGTSHWLDPRLARVRKRSLGECGEDELPFGWERVTDERYGSYYVDHINRRTQYENPVLQARRLRAEKIGTENGGTTTPNGQPPTGELRGERFTLPLTKGTQGLGFTLIGAEGVPEMEGYLQIRSIVPHSPAWIDGALRPGDVLVGVGQRGVRGLTHAQVAQIFQSIAAGETVALHVVRALGEGGAGQSDVENLGLGLCPAVDVYWLLLILTPIKLACYPLSFDSADPNTRVLSTLAVDATATAMQHLTTALRARFNLDSPNAQEVTSRDETDSSPMGHRNEPTQRCASADHLLSCNEHTTENITANEPGREFVVTLRRGAAGFGFTIADSVHGQKVKKVLDRSRCAGLREGDLLLQIGEVDVRHAPHQRVVQVLKDCPALHETTLRVWRRNNHSLRAPRSRSATRIPTTTPVNPNVSRSKTPTAEQLRSPLANTQENVNDRLNGMNSVEATYAVPEHKRERESLIDRRRRSSTPGGRLTLPAQQWDGWTHGGPEWPANSPQWPDQTQHWNGDRWGNENWSEVPTPTVHVDMNAAYWTGNASVADTSDNGFPEDGMLHSPTTATIGGLCNQSNRLRPHSPSNSTDRLRSNSPSNTSATDRLLANSPSTRQSQSPSAQSSDRVKSPNRMRDPSPPRHRSPSCYDDNLHNAGYGVNYPQVEAGGISDPMADVIVGIGRGGSGFGFRIVGGHEDGSRVAVGYVLPGGPADGLLRPGDLLTSVDGISLIGATHAKAVHCVCRAAARGHVTLGVRHNRADVQPIGIPTMVSPIQHQQPEPALHHMMPQGSYNIVHPAPMYPPAANTMYNPQYDNGWGPDAYEVTLTRNDGEGFGFVVISSTNKATSTIGQLIPNSPAARCGLLHVGDTILGINHIAIRNMAHPEVVALIKHSGERLVLTVRSAQRE